MDVAAEKSSDVCDHVDAEEGCFGWHFHIQSSAVQASGACPLRNGHAECPGDGSTSSSTVQLRMQMLHSDLPPTLALPAVRQFGMFDSLMQKTRLQLCCEAHSELNTPQLYVKELRAQTVPSLDCHFEAKCPLQCGRCRALC